MFLLVSFIASTRIITAHVLLINMFVSVKNHILLSFYMYDTEYFGYQRARYIAAEPITLKV